MKSTLLHILRFSAALFPLTLLPNIVVCQTQDSKAVNLTVLVTGNTFGYFDVTPVDENTAGGIVRRKTIFEQIRTEVGADKLLLLDAGNALGYYYLLRGDRGESMISAMRALGYDAMTVGRHEFDYGKEQLRSYGDSSQNLNILCANILDQSNAQPFFKPFAIFEKGNGLRVAVLGLTDPRIQQTILNRHIEGLSFSDPIGAAKTYISQLRSQADVIIVLSHLNAADCYKLALEVPGIDLIIARAEGSNISTVTRTEVLGTADNTLILRPEHYGTSVCRAQIRVDPARKSAVATLRNIVPVSSSTPGDAEFATQLRVGAEQQYYNYSLSTFGIEPDEPLLLVDDSYTNNDLIQSLLHVMLEKTGSEIALFNNTFFRFEGVELPRYEDDPQFRKITVRTLEQILWTDNELVSMQLTGQQLAALQRMSAAQTAARQNNFLNHVQVTSSRAEEWFVHNAPFVQKSPPEYYDVVTTNFLAGGGDGYATFREGRVIMNRFIAQGALLPSNEGKALVIRDYFIRFLKEMADRKKAGLLETSALVDSSYLSRPLWRVSLSRLQLSLAAGQYRATSDYKNIGLTELRALDFTRITYEVDFRVRQDSRLFIWDNRLFGVLGQSKVTDQPLQEVTDDLFFETVLNLRPRSFESGLSLFPSGSFKYDTEFTPTERTERGITTRNPKQQDITLGLGVGVSEFAGFNRTRLSLTQTFDRSRNPRPDENGINLQTMYQLPILSSTLRSEFDGTYYIKQKRSTGDTRRLLVRWRSDIAIPIGSLVIGPSLNVFLFRGHKSSVVGQSPKIATAVVVGVTLGFSKEWKVQYEPLF